MDCKKYAFINKKKVIIRSFIGLTVGFKFYKILSMPKINIELWRIRIMFLSKSFRKFLSAALIPVLMIQGVKINNHVHAHGDFPDKQVFAEKEGLLCSWEGVGTGTNQKIIFGKTPKTNTPIAWWIASRVFLNGTKSKNPGRSSHMIIYSVRGLAEDLFNDNESNSISYDSLESKVKEEFKYMTQYGGQAFPNHYGLSSLRKNLKAIFSSNDRFSKGEKKLIRESVIKTFDSKNHVDYQTNENLYLPSGNKKLGVISWGAEDVSKFNDISEVDESCLIPFEYLVDNSENDSRVMWLRSADGEKSNCALVSMPFGEVEVGSQRISYGFDYLPMCKISVEDLLFASAASSTFADSPCTLNGKFAVIDKSNNNYGMNLKYRASGTELTDALVEVDENNPAVVHYYNAPVNSFVTVCAVEKEDISKSYYAALKVNNSGNDPDGLVDLSKLNSDNIGVEKDLQVKVWIERQEQDGIVVATPAETTSFKTDSHKFTINGVSPVVYDGKEKTLENLSVCLDGDVLNSETDFDVEYFENKNVGTALVVVKGKGNYLGYVNSETFEITKAIPKISLKDKVVEFNNEGQLIDSACVTGIEGELLPEAKIKYTYYLDENCTKKICNYSLSSKGTKTPTKAPKDVGIYFVKAVFSENNEYCSVESPVAKLIIKETI